jgi:probable F420-dependent oxidoreductase
MSEAITVIKGLWSESPFTFTGQHYTITDYDSQPKPLQQPHPPILVGGGGKRLLGIAAREADIVGIAPGTGGGGIQYQDETHEMLAQKVEWLRQAAGDRFDQLELGMFVWSVAVTSNRQAAADGIAGRALRSVRTADHILASPYYLIGSVDEIVDQLVEQRKRTGISYVEVLPSDTRAFAPVVARLAGT